VFGIDGVLMGALTISAPTTRLTAEYAKTLMEPMRLAASDLTKALGGRPPSMERVEQGGVAQP
jgi:DNA-binding IclR family transcriptional regulator